MSLDTTALESEISELEAEINIAAELIEECIKENAHVALDQAEYQKRYDALVVRFDKAKARHTEVTDLIAERMARKHQIEAYLKNLRSREPLTEFRETDWLAMVDYITVHSKKNIRVIFKERLRQKTSSWDSGLRKSLPTFCTQLQLMANKPFNFATPFN